MNLKFPMTNIYKYKEFIDLYISPLEFQIYRLKFLVNYFFKQVITIDLYICFHKMTSFMVTLNLINFVLIFIKIYF